MSKTFASTGNGSKKGKGRETSSGNLELNITDITDIIKKDKISTSIEKEEINQPLPLIEKEESREPTVDKNHKINNYYNSKLIDLLQVVI